MLSFSSEKITTAYILQFGPQPLSNELVCGGSSSRDDGERNASPGLLHSKSGRPRSVVVEGLSGSGEAEDNPVDPPKSPVSGSRREHTKESGTVWCAVGRSEGVGGASGHLRRTPYADGYGNGENLVRQKRIT